MVLFVGINESFKTKNYEMQSKYHEGSKRIGENWRGLEKIIVDCRGSERIVEDRKGSERIGEDQKGL